MKEHYRLNDVNYAKLIKSGVTNLDFLNSITIFDPIKSNLELSLINLYYYVDSVGDFNARPSCAHKKIAKAMFEQLETSEKLNLLEYIEQNATT